MKHVIIVDDDPAIRDAFRLNLERAGYTVSVYTNGNSLLAGNFATPDLIILDKQLSGADGLDICRVLKQRDNTKQVPVIMLSASPHIHQLARDAGAEDFLEKPFRLKDLLAMIERYI